MKEHTITIEKVGDDRYRLMIDGKYIGTFSLAEATKEIDKLHEREEQK